MSTSGRMNKYIAVYLYSGIVENVRIHKLQLYTAAYGVKETRHKNYVAIWFFLPGT